ncbi:MAG: hypothetical protein ACI4UM_08405 [Succinivibrio sp.]
MIFDSEPVVWKLKKGVVISYGPELAANEAGTENIIREQAELSAKTDSSLSAVRSSDMREEQITETVQTDISLSAASVTDNSTQGTPVQTQSQIDTALSGRAQCLQSSPVLVDGREVDPKAVNSAAASMPKWVSLPYRLRKHRADVFVKATSAVPFAQSLFNYLRTKGLDVKDYDESVNYLPSDILLLDNTDLVRQGTVIVLQEGKRAVWDKLLSEFGDRLK